MEAGCWDIEEEEEETIVDKYPDVDWDFVVFKFVEDVEQVEEEEEAEPVEPVEHPLLLLECFCCFW